MKTCNILEEVRKRKTSHPQQSAYSNESFNSAQKKPLNMCFALVLSICLIEDNGPKYLLKAPALQRCRCFPTFTAQKLIDSRATDHRANQQHVNKE